MTSTLQTNINKKHFKAGDNCCFSVYFFDIRNAVTQFNIRSSNTTDYKRTDVTYVLFVFGWEKNSSDFV